MSVPTREFFSTPTGSASRPFPSDDIVRCLLGFRPSTVGNAADAARILITARTAFAKRPRPTEAAGGPPGESLITLAPSPPSPPSNDVAVGARTSAMGNSGPTSDPTRRKGEVGVIGSGLAHSGPGVTARSASPYFSSSLGELRRDTARALSSETRSPRSRMRSAVQREKPRAASRGS